MRYCTALIALLLISLPVMAYPNDPPVGNDFVTYGGVGAIPYRRDNENKAAPFLAVGIAPDNPSFVEGHAQTAGSDNVLHYHCDKDYGDDFGTPHGVVEGYEGIFFWNYFYAGYSPAVERAEEDGQCTNMFNCMAFAYHGSKDNAVAVYWVDPSDAAAYREELHEEYSPGYNGSVVVEYRDVCDCIGYHAWMIWQANACAATEIVWKNGASPVMHWEHDTFCSNVCPDPDNPNDYDYYFGIYRDE